MPELGATVGEALLEPHRSYLPLVQPLLDGGRIKGMAHITGGGITDNLPRILPHGTGGRRRLRRRGRCRRSSAGCRTAGGVAVDDMMRTFNMGIGLIIVDRARIRPSR